MAEDALATEEVHASCESWITYPLVADAARNPMRRSLPPDGEELLKSGLCKHTMPHTAVPTAVIVAVLPPLDGTSVAHESILAWRHVVGE